MGRKWKNNKNLMMKDFKIMKTKNVKVKNT